MKLTKFFTESILTDCFQPRKKNGSEKRKMSYEYELKKDLAEYQNQWQSAENDKDRNWQEAQWMREFSSQQDEWKRQFELQNSEWSNRFSQENSEWSRRFAAENAYNDPSAQIARLQKAGLNAISFMGGDAAGLSAAPTVQSTPSVGSPAPPSPSSAGTHQFSPSPLPNFSSVSSSAQMFQSLAALNDALAKTAQTGLNVERQKTLLDAEFSAVLAKADSDRQAALFTGIKAGLEATHGPDKWKSEIGLNLMQSYLANMQGDNQSALKHYNEAMTQFVGAQKSYLENASPDLLANLKYLGTLLKNQGETEAVKPALLRSEMSRNYASALESKSQSQYLAALTDTENGLRSGRITAQELSNDIAGIQKLITNRENVIGEQTKQAKIEALTKEFERAGLINDQMREDIKRAAIANDWANVEHALGCVKTAVSTVADAASIANVGVNALTSFQRNNIQRQANQMYYEVGKERNDVLRQHYSPQERAVVGGFSNY